MARFRFTNQYSTQPQAIIAFYEDIIGLDTCPGNSVDGSWHGFYRATAQFAVEPEFNRKDNTEKFKANWDNPYLVQIEVESLDEMRQIIARAKRAGIEVLTELEKRSYGTISKILDPDNNMIELLHGWGYGKIRKLFVLENPAGSYKDFGAQDVYPLAGVRFYADYGYIEGYVGEDGHDLDMFMGDGGSLQGFITVWRGLDIPQEHKFYVDLTEDQLQKTLKEYDKVLINQESLTEPELLDAISGFLSANHL